VAYDPKVVTIRDYFQAHEFPIDYLLFSNDEAQIEALLIRRIDIAWNTNWVRMLETGKADSRQVKGIWSFPGYSPVTLPCRAASIPKRAVALRISLWGWTPVSLRSGG